MKKSKEKKELTEKEYAIYEKGFEDGYSIAKRLYKVISHNYVTQADLEDKISHKHEK